MTAVRLVWRAGQALALGRPNPAALEDLRRHRDELLPVVEAFGDVMIEVRPKPATDWEAVRRMLAIRPRRRQPTRRRA